jgi:hypothetical protein
MYLREEIQTMKIGPEDERLIVSLWRRGWSAREIANYMWQMDIKYVYAVLSHLKED